MEFASRLINRHLPWPNFSLILLWSLDTKITSGSIFFMALKEGEKKPPTIFFVAASEGYVSWQVTALSASPAPILKTISVIVGTRETTIEGLFSMVILFPSESVNVTG